MNPAVIQRRETRREAISSCARLLLLDIANIRREDPGFARGRSTRIDGHGIEFPQGRELAVLLKGPVHGRATRLGRSGRRIPQARERPLLKLSDPRGTHVLVAPLSRGAPVLNETRRNAGALDARPRGPTIGPAGIRVATNAPPPSTEKASIRVGPTRWNRIIWSCHISSMRSCHSRCDSRSNARGHLLYRGHILSQCAGSTRLARRRRRRRHPPDPHSKHDKKKRPQCSVHL